MLEVEVVLEVGTVWDVGVNLKLGLVLKAGVGRCGLCFRWRGNCRWDCCLISCGFGVRRDVGDRVGWCWNGVDVRVGLGLELGVLELGLLLKLERVLVSEGGACFEVEWYWRWDWCLSWGGVEVDECYWR